MHFFTVGQWQNHRWPTVDSPLANGNFAYPEQKVKKNGGETDCRFHPHF